MEQPIHQHIRERVLLAKVLPLDTPFSLIIDVISRCNFKCNFCFHSLRKYKQKELNFIPGVMEYVLFKKIIDQIAEFPNKLKRLSVNFRGEPLLHNKLPDMISYAKKKDVSEFITLTTNGYLLEPKLNRKLVSAGLDDLRVSVEALSTERYKEITGVSVNYDRFLNNIRNFYINKGKCKVNIKIVDIGLNLDEEQKFYQMFEDISDNAVIERIIPMYDQVNYNVIKSDFSRDLRGDKYKKIEVCSEPFFYLYVLHNGDVSVCCRDFGGKIVFGNVNDSSLIDIWNGLNLKRFRQMQLKKKRHLHPECGKCAYPSYNTHKQDVLDSYTDELLSYFL